MATSSWRTAAIAGLLASACFPTSDGAQPPPELIHFPVGLALSDSGDRLYIANSDFDLRYQAGRVLAIDLARVRELLPDFSGPDPCGVLADVLGDRTEKTESERVISPGLCCPLFLNPGARQSDGYDICAGRANGIGVDPFHILRGSVAIGAFATDMIHQQSPDGDWGRLLIPTRGDAELYWIDVEKPDSGERFELDCDQSTLTGACALAHGRGGDDDPFSDATDRLAIEPFSVASTQDGRVIVTSHRTQGTVSLFLNDWENGINGGPRLTEVVPGLPLAPMSVTAVPASQTERARDDYNPGFLVTFAQVPAQIQLLRYYEPEGGAECFPKYGCLPGPTLRSVATTFITPTLATDSRGIAMDDNLRRRCESECSDDDCLGDCATIPVGVYVANRTPTSLLVGQTVPNHSDTGTGDLPKLDHAVSVRTGPSRVVLGQIAGVPEEESHRVFLVAFDSRFVYVYDPVRDAIEARIYTGRGPHPFVVDSKRGFGYVGHFTDSSVGVVDLRKCYLGETGEVVLPCVPNPHFGEIVLTIGQPTPPRASK